MLSVCESCHFSQSVTRKQEGSKAISNGKQACCWSFASKIAGRAIHHSNQITFYIAPNTSFMTVCRNAMLYLSYLPIIHPFLLVCVDCAAINLGLEPAMVIWPWSSCSCHVQGLWTTHHLSMLCTVADSASDDSKQRKRGNILAWVYILSDFWLRWLCSVLLVAWINKWGAQVRAKQQNIDDLMISCPAVDEFSARHISEPHML